MITVLGSQGLVLDYLKIILILLSILKCMKIGFLIGSFVSVAKI